jgi:hypothetical protein
MLGLALKIICRPGMRVQLLKWLWAGDHAVEQDIGSGPQRNARHDRPRVDLPRAASGCRVSEDEEDQEGDGEAEEAGCFGQREAKKRKGLHLTLGGRVAGDGVDQGREHIADADAGADERYAGKASPDHFGGSEIHIDVPFG